MKLVGREVELGAISRAVAAVQGGDSRVLAIVGEAGIGKSALLEAVATAAGDLRVASGRAAEHERDLPFALAADALAPHTRELDPSIVAGDCPAPPANAAERFRLHRELGGIIGRLGPLVLLFDDVQWADDASLELILHLLSRPPQVPHLLVFAARPCPAATRLLAAAHAIEQLSPQRLDDVAARTMLGEVPDAERLVREAAGLPLYLRELARAPQELPLTLRAAVESEAAALDDRARVLLRGAAVAGDPFDPELAAAGAGVPADVGALDRLAAADLVRRSGDARGFAFRHPLVRRAVYDATPPGWRLAAHERVAAALAARGAAPAKRAYHVARVARAGDGEAIALLRRAAEAAARSSPATAANWYAAALPLVHEDDRGDILGPLARSLAAAGRLEASLDRLHEALELAPRDLELLLTCARVEGLRGHHAVARRRLEAAYAAQPHPRLAFELAAAAMMAADSAALRAWATTAERLAGERVRGAVATVTATDFASAAGEGSAANLAHDAVLVVAARVLGALGAAWAGERPPAVDPLAQLDAFDDRSLSAHPTVLLHVSRALLRLGRTDEATVLLRRAVAIARRTSSGEMLVWLLGVQAWALWLALDLDGALAAAEAAEATARLQSATNPLLVALSARAAIHHERDEPADAARATADCRALIAELEPSDTTRAATAVLATLDPDGADSLADLDPSWAARYALVRVRTALAAGRVDEAEHLARAVTAPGGRANAASKPALTALPLAAARAEMARAEVLLARGESRAAAALAEAAATAAEGRSTPARVFNSRLRRAVAEAAPAEVHRSALDAAEARLLQGRALAAAGETDRAKAVLQRLAADAARANAQRLMSAAARALRGLGTRVSATARRHERAELSEREREIAQLVADGNSNKQVAATLYLSEKTVENALTRVYAKVGVRSRVQLARAWA